MIFSKETVRLKSGSSLTLYYFDVPMFHDNWHCADKEGLVYVNYNNLGPDYWDAKMEFVKAEDKELHKLWEEENPPW